jgi:hypothetical protein
MVRRNLHLPDKQYLAMQKLAKKLGVSVADMYREGGDMIIRKTVEELKANAAKRT